MGDLLRLPVMTPRVRDDARCREEDLRSAELTRRPRGSMASWMAMTTMLTRSVASRRRHWNRDDRHLMAATNALLMDRPPRGGALSLDDREALRIAIALRNLHPGGDAPRPTYV